MILSASRREDMPAMRPDELARMLVSGRAEAVNPFNPSQRRQVDLSPGAVEGIVLWSKDPRSLLEGPLQRALLPYPFYVQFTLNGYGAELEPGVPPLDVRLDAFRRLADAYGPLRVRWRYDPIALTPLCTPAWHEDTFGAIAHALRGCADGCTISFLDVYRRIRRAMRALSMRPPEGEEALSIARALSAIAAQCGISLCACAEPADYAPLGILPARCIDDTRLSRIAGRPITAPRDANQRPHCACAKSVDIGRYGACAHACAYCYARR